MIQPSKPSKIKASFTDEARALQGELAIETSKYFGVTDPCHHRRSAVAFEHSAREPDRRCERLFRSYCRDGTQRGLGTGPFGMPHCVALSFCLAIEWTNLEHPPWTEHVPLP
jgi:hypothetical protein